MRKLLLAGALAVVGLGSGAQAETINFDNLSTGITTNPLIQGGATFSTTIGTGLYIGNFNTNQLCAYVGGMCTGNLNVLFAQGANGLTFSVAGADSASAILTAAVQYGTTGMATFTFTGFATGGSTNNFLNFGGLSNIRSVTFTNNDSYGLSFDNFVFTPAVTPTASVPEPLVWLMMTLGFGAVGAALRRRAPTRDLQHA